MDVISCKGCGRLFNALTRKKYCPVCEKIMEDKFQEVKTFINENPGATVEIVSKECNVAAKQIKQWVREERLVFSGDSVHGIECEQCGAMIRSGRFCNACKMKLQTDFKNATYKKTEPEVKKPAKDKDRMRFL